MRFGKVEILNKMKIFFFQFTEWRNDSVQLVAGGKESRIYTLDFSLESFPRKKENNQLMAEQIESENRRFL